MTIRCRAVHRDDQTQTGFPKGGLRSLLPLAVLIAAGGSVGAPQVLGQSSYCGSVVCQWNGNIVVSSDSSAAVPAQMTVQGQSNANQQLLIGYSTASNYGSIQAAQGTAQQPLILNGSGGAVGIGTTAPTSNVALHVNAAGPAFVKISDSATGTYGLIYSDGNFHVESTGQTLWLNHDSAGNLVLAYGGGNVGIGTYTPSYKLAVKGTIGAQEVVVLSTTAWPDYVFAPDYKLAPLSEVGEFVKANHRLPEIPSAMEVAENGVSVGDMQAKLLAKIEELTLHMIAAEERAERLEKENAQLRERVGRLEVK